MLYISRMRIVLCIFLLNSFFASSQNDCNQVFSKDNSKIIKTYDIHIFDEGNRKVYVSLENKNGENYIVYKSVFHKDSIKIIAANWYSTMTVCGGGWSYPLEEKDILHYKNGKEEIVEYRVSFKYSLCHPETKFSLTKVMIARSKSYNLDHEEYTVSFRAAKTFQTYLKCFKKRVHMTSLK